MKTTAEEKLLRSLEMNITLASKTMTRAAFKKAAAESHKIAEDVVEKHRRMIGLWTAMDVRLQRLAKKIMATAELKEK